MKLFDKFDKFFKLLINFAFNFTLRLHTPELLSVEHLDCAEVARGDRSTVQLVYEVAKDGHSCLVFCHSRDKAGASTPPLLSST